MRKIIFLLMCLSMAWPALAAPPAISSQVPAISDVPVSAQKSAIAVVDVVRILTQSDAAKSIQAQREKLRTNFLAEISKTEQDLSQQEKILSDPAAQASPQDYAKKKRAYEEKLIAVRKMAQDKKRILEEASKKAMDSLRDQLYTVVQDIAHERGYSLVISNKDVIAGEKSLDITEETFRRLNEKVKNIALELGD